MPGGKLFLSSSILSQTACSTWTTFASGVAMTYQGGRNVAVRVGNGAVVHRAQLDAPDVADPRDAPLWVRFDDDVAELLGRGEAAERLDVDLVGGVARDRRLVQHTCRNLGG